MRALLFVVLIACQSKPSPSQGSGTGSATGSSGSATAPATTLEIALPKPSGKPPAKTTAPLDKATLARVAQLTFPQFNREVTEFPANIAIRQRATLRPRMSVNVYVGPCTEELKCLPMSLEAWTAAKAELQPKYLEAELAERPDTTFEIGATTIGGAPAIYIYQAAQFFGRDERGNPVGSYSHAYSLHYNDGINSLRVTVNFADDARDSLAEMTRALPREFLERVAVAFLDAYGQAWAP